MIASKAVKILKIAERKEDASMAAAALGLWFKTNGYANENNAHEMAVAYLEGCTLDLLFFARFEIEKLARQFKNEVHRFFKPWYGGFFA